MSERIVRFPVDQEKYKAAQRHATDQVLRDIQDHVIGKEIGIELLDYTFYNDILRTGRNLTESQRLDHQRIGTKLFERFGVGIGRVTNAYMNAEYLEATNEELELANSKVIL